MLRSFLSAFCAFVMPLSASAAVLDYTYAADYSFTQVLSGFDETGDYDANRLETRASITGKLSFDDTLVNDFGDSLRFGPVAITIDSFIPLGTEMPITSTNFSDDAGLDSILTGNGGMPATNPPGEYTLLGLFLVDDTNTLFPGGPVFPDLIELSDFTRARITLRSTLFDPTLGPPDQPTKIVGFDITQLTPVQDPSTVPLPAGLPLLLGGLAILGWASGRRAGRT
jgi:hypothetical protein